MEKCQSLLYTEDNIYDKMIARLSEEQKAILNKRYSSLDLHPEKMKFIDRMVADSRQIALKPYRRTFPAPTKCR